ncbi:MAG: flagellar export chaperone FliS [Bacillota bacterium]|nr:flagellar export chaperone FliS [Bacillota bacterium]
MGANPYAQYKKVQVETADQGRLLLMLYDGALRFLGRARVCLEEGDLQGTNNNILRVQDIIAELMSSLKLEVGGVALSLYSLYEYMHHLLVQANISKDGVPLGQVEEMLKELAASWRESIEGKIIPREMGNQVKKLIEIDEDGPGESEKVQDKMQAKSKSGYEQKTRDEEFLQEGSSRLNISG